MATIVLILRSTAICNEFGLAPDATADSSGDDLAKSELQEQNALQTYAIDQAAFNTVGRVPLIKRLFEFSDSDMQRYVCSSMERFGVDS